RPLKALRYLVRAGCSMLVYLQALAGSAWRSPPGQPPPPPPPPPPPRAPAAAPALLRFERALLGRHRIVLHDLALEDPHLHADDAVRRLGQAVAEIDIGAERVRRHAPLAIPLHPCDLGA